jgi:spermidine synthase
VLVVVLLCLATGAGLVSLTSGLIPAPRLLVAALIAECLLLLALPGQFAGFEVAAEGGRAVAGLRTAILLGGPAMLVGALVLPLTFRLSRGGSVGEQTGGLLSANTAGGILGSLAAGFVLLESFGIWPSIAIVGLGYGVAAIALPGPPPQRVGRAALLAMVCVAILSSSIDPWQLPRVALGPGDRLVDLREGAHGVVSVIDKGPNRLMKIDNHYTLSGAGPLGSRKERTGHIPLLLHPEPRRVAFIGSATGHTSGAAVVHPVEEIVLVEIVPEVQELAARHFSKSNRGVHHDPRTRLVVEDGRNHLRATDELFDVIVADLFSPWRPGVGSLYTREHFEAVRRRLAPGGLFCQWLPAYQHRQQTFESIAATFLQVYPNATVWRGDFYRTLPRVALIGFEAAPPSVSQVNDRVRALARRGVQDRWVVRPRGFWMLYVGPLAALAPSLSRTPLNSDARPRFEYLAGRSSPFEIHEFLSRGWPRISERLLAGARIDKTFEAAMPSVEDGAELVRLNALHLAGREEAFRLSLARLRERLPVALIERPDPTVAEMWAPGWAGTRPAGDGAERLH